MRKDNAAAGVLAPDPHGGVPWLLPLHTPHGLFKKAKILGENLMNNQSCPGQLWVQSHRTQSDLGAENR